MYNLPQNHCDYERGSQTYNEARLGGGFIVWTRFGALFGVN